MRAVATTLMVVVGIWVVLVLAAWGLQRQLIYLPTAGTPSPPPAHLEVEELTVPTADGLDLAAWYLEPDDDPPVATVLALPGNAGDRSLRLPLARGLMARGHAVLLLDYRGYGGNPGRPSEPGLAQDARAAREQLLAQDLDADRLVYLGESVGSGVAAGLAREHPPAALVLRSPFPELAEVARVHYPFLPVRTLLRDRFEVLDDLADYAGPLLVVAGGQDTIVPTRLSRRVAEETDATYVELDGADHNDRALLDGDDYLDAVDDFLRTTLGRP